EGEIAVGEGPLAPEGAVEDEDLVAGGDEDVLAVDGDPAQAAVAAAPLPVDRAVVPVDRLLPAAALEIEEVDPAMAVALVGGAHHGGEDDGRQGHGRGLGGFTAGGRSRGARSRGG